MNEGPRTGDLVQVTSTWMYGGYVGLVMGVFGDTINILFGGSIGQMTMFANRVRVLERAREAR